MWFFTNCTFFQQQCCEIEVVKLIGQQALSVRRATRKDLWIFFGAFKRQNENSRRCLWKERPAHIFHHRSLDLSFIVLAPPQNIKQKGAFSSILRATLLMRKKGRSRAWLAVLTVFGRFRLPKHLWRARLSPLGWGAGAKVQFGVDNVCDLSLIHIWRCRRSYACRSRWSPYH